MAEVLEPLLLTEFLVSVFALAPALATESTWGMNQQMEDSLFCVSLSLFISQ